MCRFLNLGYQDQLWELNDTFNLISSVYDYAQETPLMEDLSLCLV